MKSAYIHIPFCQHICHYCDFNKVFLKNQPVDQYLDMLRKEMENAVSRHDHKNLQTIFIGGGTPTALSSQQLQKLLTSIAEVLQPDTGRIEYSIEANPGDLPLEKFQLLKSFGINRLSFGVQSFNNSLLSAIGRAHQAEDVFRSLELAGKAGFENISLDLMYGLPGQSAADFERDLDIALKLDVAHFSAYSLIIEPKTVFYNLSRKGKLPLPPQEDEAVMYETAMDRMESMGYHQYEISNYSLPGFESRHNITYWKNEQYFGFGAGAHSYVDGYRNANFGPLKKYMNAVGEQGLPYVSSHEVPKSEAMEEELFLGLRMSDGVSESHFSSKFGIELNRVFQDQIEEGIHKGLLVKSGDMLALTRRGRLLGNEVFSSFLGAAE
ncbi:radical SAM family heme chaperone HemW [Metabacillus lacus]|uniref:radical SAM family heme chaperone HemW n=1 Tax=Metabacillus lacus TaxID=1983721 RepID=UPI0031B5E4DA